MEKETMLVIRKDNGERQLIVADRFNPELHSEVVEDDESVGAAPEATESLVSDETPQDVQEDLSKLKTKELKELAQEKGLATQGLKKKELLSLLSK